MKQIIILLLAILTIKTQAQLHSSFAAGYDTHGHPMYNLNFGYEYHQLQIDGEIRPAFTRAVDAHNYVGGMISLNLIDSYFTNAYLLAGAGYYYDLLNDGNKQQMNRFYLAASLKAGWYVKNTAPVFLQVMYINHSMQFSLGFSLIFTDN